MNFEQALIIHKKLFPKATYRSQILKFNEEFDEYNTAEALEDVKNEYGDLLFVIISMRRFPETSKIAEILLDKYYFNYSIDQRKRFMKYLERAVEKVKQRCSENRYQFVNGIYTRKNFYKGETHAEKI